MKKQSIEVLISRYIEVIDQGIELIEKMTSEQYVFSRQTDHGTIGTHFRHIMDFVSRFLEGIDGGKIDYNLRRRDVETEIDREYAIFRLRKQIQELQNLTAEMGERQILIHLEPGNYENEEDAWCISSVLRELEFLQSHTLHHYALIAAKLSIQGVETNKEFGVAPSTLDFWNRGKAQKKSV